MTSSSTKIHAFHPYVDAAYAAVHQWLVRQQGACGYRRIDYTGENVARSLREASLLHSAFQYYTLFPAHYFKVVHALDEILGPRMLVDWLSRAPHLCVLDIGCGAGAASAALVAGILRLQDDGALVHPVKVFCLGVDPNQFSLQIYFKLMQDLKARVDPTRVQLEYVIEPRGIHDGILDVMRALTQRREQWNQPYIPHVLAMQINVVSPLGGEHEARRQVHSMFKDLGVGPDALIDDFDQFGQKEALAYKDLFDRVPIDHLHIITVGTDETSLASRVQDMGQAIEQTFSGGRHDVEKINDAKHEVKYSNPASSYWVERLRRPSYLSNYYLHFVTITSAALRDDAEWNGVVSEENLKLAWARARHHLLNESLADEVELRLFEHNLDRNIAQLKEDLFAYAQEVVRTDRRFAYKFPKASHVRPRGLSSIEETILSIAIIQHLGKRADGLKGHSYAYSISKGRDTEYLYEPWFKAYQGRFLADARRFAQDYEDCVIVQADIKSFFTRIIQERLIELATKELRVDSERIKWLLRLLLSKDIDDHEVGQGLVQGNPDSGFYANIYLVDLDSRFADHNEWGLRFFRYVDDMIFIIPHRSQVRPVLETLREELSKTGLELNEDKTEIYTDVSAFLAATSDDLLESLSERSASVLNAIWIMDRNQRTTFREAFLQAGEPWWHGIGIYNDCLRSIAIFEGIEHLSRKVYRYLFNSLRRTRDLKRESELSLPPLPSEATIESVGEWSLQFQGSNLEWHSDKDELRGILIELFRESWRALSLPLRERGSERKLTRHLRFAVNKLGELGFGELHEAVTAVLCDQPWLIREPAATIAALALQNFPQDIERILHHYELGFTPIDEFMRAVTLRAMRYMPQLTLAQWKMLTEYTTSASVVESLLASETWLYLGDRSKLLVSDQEIQSLNCALRRRPPIPLRLRKNYLLILKRFDPVGLTDDVEADRHELLREMRDIASEVGEADLFDEREPDVIRRSYYSGREPDDGGLY